MTNCTASALYSGVNLRRVLPIVIVSRRSVSNVVTVYKIGNGPVSGTAAPAASAAGLHPATEAGY
jgi:hypothetical protein